MYVITNRHLKKERGDLGIFSKEPNQKGPNELRLVKVTGSGNNYKAVATKEVAIPDSKKNAIAKLYDLDPDDPLLDMPSLHVAHDIFTEAAKSKRHILVFVHGYNNDMKDVMVTAKKIEALYKVRVVPFSWPANGGGVISGTASYKSDKRDARVSTGAFDRFIEKLHEYHKLFVTARRKKLMALARETHPDNHQEAKAEFSRLLAKECKVTINLLCHSMGNYLLKYATSSSTAMMRELVFDNINLVAADTNNKNHRDWVGGMESRSGVYVVINEEDSALGYSRKKPGEEQLARLGHYLKGLNAVNATYLNVTSRNVDDDHSYFKDKPVKGDDKLKAMFAALFEGRRPESKMRYRPDINAYNLR
jgi:esterase/lipase superfamily enzyme